MPPAGRTRKHGPPGERLGILGGQIPREASGGSVSVVETGMLESLVWPSFGW